MSVHVSAKTRFIAGLTAGATALAMMTAPAFADKKSDRMLLALLGIGAMALIATDASRKAEAAPQPQQPRVEVQPSALPRACAMKISGLRGESRGYGEACLTNYGVNYRLPQHCAHRTVVQGRSDRIYAENCMASAGFVPGR